MNPAALAAHIANVTGQDHRAAGSHDRAVPRRCPHCHALTLVGLDAEVAALSVRVDPGSLTVRDEATALLTGRRTFVLRPHRDRWVIRHRDRWAIAGHPAGTVHVVAEHHCGAVLAPPPTPARQEAATDVIPF